jgi:hypothetical protein
MNHTNSKPEGQEKDQITHMAFAQQSTSKKKWKVNHQVLASMAE